MNGSAQAAVIVVNYNTRDETATAIRTLLENNATSLEVVFVDNGTY